jgi:hypothetical protein
MVFEEILGYILRELEQHENQNEYYNVFDSISNDVNAIVFLCTYPEHRY